MIQNTVITLLITAIVLGLFMLPAVAVIQEGHDAGQPLPDSRECHRGT